MKAGLSLIVVMALVSLLNCSGDKTDKQTPKPQASLSAPAHVEAKPTIPTINSPNAQDLQPDLHLSGTQNTHISGITSTSEHISGQ